MTAIPLLAVLLCLAGCASAPQPADLPGESSVQIHMLDSDTLKTRFGPNDSVNPYMPYRSIIFGTRDEFIVFEVEAELAADGPVKVSGSVIDANGKSVAVLRDFLYMEDYWRNYNGGSTESVCLKKLRQTYMKRNPLKAKAGSQKFIVMLVGKNPIPRPAAVSIAVEVPGMKTAEFSFDLLK